MPCASCGVDVSTEFCLYHSLAWEHWAAMNRAFCDLLHRGQDLATPRARIIEEK